MYLWFSWLCCSRRMNPCISWEHVLDLSFDCSLCLCIRVSKLWYLQFVEPWWCVLASEDAVVCFKWFRAPAIESNRAMLDFLAVFREMEFVQRNRLCKDWETVTETETPFGKRTIKTIAQSKKYLSAFLSLLGLVFFIEI